MPQYQDPAAADALRYLRGRVDSLQKEVDFLKAAQGAAFLPRGDHEGYPNPSEGQTMVNYVSDQAYYYSRQQWRPFGGDDRPWARRSKGFDASNQSIGNNSFTDVTFNHDYNMGTGESGEPYFAAVGTTGISVLQAGVYAITAKVNWFDAMGTTAWLMGPNVLSPPDDYIDLDAKGASSSTTMVGIVSQVRRLGADTREVRLTVWQITGSAKNIDVATLEIVRLGTYTGDDTNDLNPAI